MDYMIGAFYSLFLWNFKKESINRFMAQPTAKKPCGALMRVLRCGTRPLFTAGKGGPDFEIFTFSVVS